jgi:hypothetical protein
MIMGCERRDVDAPSQHGGTLYLDALHLYLGRIGLKEEGIILIRFENWSKAVATNEIAFSQRSGPTAFQLFLGHILARASPLPGHLSLAQQQPSCASIRSACAIHLMQFVFMTEHCYGSLA